MKTDSITWGETYDISVEARDADGVAIVLDETYQAGCRVTAKLGGEAIIDVPVAIVGGKITASIDTGDAPWTAGTYYYDVRTTDPDGHDYWTEPVKLTLKNRNTPNT